MVAEALQNDSDVGYCFFQGTTDNVERLLNATSCDKFTEQSGGLVPKLSLGI
jgi:hypothetical protein